MSLRKPRHLQHIERAQRKEDVLARPGGREVWEALTLNRVTFSSRLPIYPMQIEEFYIRLVNDVLDAIASSTRERNV